METKPQTIMHIISIVEYYNDDAEVHSFNLFWSVALSACKRAISAGDYGATAGLSPSQSLEIILRLFLCGS